MEEEGERDPAAPCESWIIAAPEPLEEYEGLFLQTMVPWCWDRDLRFSVCLVSTGMQNRPLPSTSPLPPRCGGTRKEKGDP